MSLDELKKIEQLTLRLLSEYVDDNHVYRVLISYPDSPNPSCFFEIDGIFFVQGQFWANDEFAIKCMRNNLDELIIDRSGTYSSIDDVKYYVQMVCDKIS